MQGDGGEMLGKEVFYVYRDYGYEGSRTFIGKGLVVSWDPRSGLYALSSGCKIEQFVLPDNLHLDLAKATEHARVQTEDDRRYQEKCEQERLERIRADIAKAERRWWRRLRKWATKGSAR